MAIVMMRQSSCSCCWSQLVSSGGRYIPMRTLQIYFGKSATGYCSLWASQRVHHRTPKKGSLVYSEHLQLHFKFFKTKRGDTLLSLHAKLYAPRRSMQLRNCSFVTPDILLMTRQQHVISGQGWLWSHVNLHWWTFASAHTRTLWHIHVQKYSITKMTHFTCRARPYYTQV